MLNPNPDSADVQFQSLLNCNNPSFGSEWIEIFNNSECDTVFLDCYILSIRTSGANSGGFAFPPGTQIAPLAHLLLGGANVANADFNLNAFCNSDSICGGTLSLENAVGYVALYRQDGSVSDAVYWTDLPSQPNELITNAVFNNVPCIPARCVINGGLKLPNQMTPGLEISYAGQTPNMGFSIHRSLDGNGGWQRTASPTPGTCNGGTCRPVSDLIVVLDSLSFERCQLKNGFLAVHAEGGMPPYDFDWSNGDGDSLIANLTAGTFTVTATDFAGCKDTFNVNLPNIGNPVNINIEPAEVTIFQGDSIALAAISNSILVELIWRPSTRLTCNNCMNPIAFPNNSTTYTLSVADLDSCIADVSVFVKVLPDEKSVFIPNIITPNGDGKNDELLIRSIRINTMKFRIFDRWGKEVFATSDINEPWTGKDKNGNKLVNGVYAYLLEAQFNNGKERVFKGNITLVK